MRVRPTIATAGPVAALGAALTAAPVNAHAGSLRASADPLSVPFWLVILTGGGVVAASFLLTSFVTDRGLIRAVHDWGRVVSTRGALARTGRRAARATGVIVLIAIVVSGLFGPPDAVANFATVAVWVGWWAGFTISVYAVGNTWPLVNPWRTLAGLLPAIRRRRYPERVGAWPSVVALLALVWLEVVSPIAEHPRLLAAAVLGYTAITVLGVAAYGPATWFGAVDPLAQVFRYYGRIAPLRRTDEGVQLGSFGATRPVDSRADVAFVVALLWGTTFDGLVSTPVWAGTVRAVVDAGVPPLVAYGAALVGGFALFLGVYRGASRLVRRTAGAYVTAYEIETRFAVSLLPIAAGYHLAHFLGYFLSWLPVLAAAATNPLAPVHAAPIALPGWFGGLSLWFVLAGHVFAVWLAHTTAFDLFTGRLQPIRSQYPYVLLMIGYTMTSLWIVAQPSVSPPYVL